MEREHRCQSSVGGLPAAPRLTDRQGQRATGAIPHTNWDLSQTGGGSSILAQRRPKSLRPATAADLPG